MAVRVALATTNPGKVREVAQILGPDVELVPPPPDWVPPEETEDTYRGNALLKARSLVRHTGLPALADDSGIEVRALDWGPGVRSARYAGEAASDTENLDKLLGVARRLEDGMRGARYRCFAVLVTPDGEETVCDGTVDGCLITEPRGSGGFGYDPIFVATGQERTMAELTPEEKDAISHRGAAFRAIAPAVRALGPS